MHGLPGERSTATHGKKRHGAGRIRATQQVNRIPLSGGHAGGAPIQQICWSSRFPGSRNSGQSSSNGARATQKREAFRPAPEDLQPSRSFIASPCEGRYRVSEETGAVGLRELAEMARRASTRISAMAKRPEPSRNRPFRAIGAPPRIRGTRRLSEKSGLALCMRDRVVLVPSDATGAPGRCTVESAVESPDNRGGSVRAVGRESEPNPSQLKPRPPGNRFT